MAHPFSKAFTHNACNIVLKIIAEGSTREDSSCKTIIIDIKGYVQQMRASKASIILLHMDLSYLV